MGLAIAAFLLFSFSKPSNVVSQGVPEWEITIEFAFDPETLNLSEYPPAILFDGWVNFTGYSVAPTDVHLTPSSDLGCVYFSQYDFSFHTPESIPFNGLITNDVEGNFSYPSMMISGTFTQGALQYPINPITVFIPAYYFIEEDEGIPKCPEPPKSDDFPFLLIFLTISFFVIYVIIKRSRLSRNAKVICQTNAR